MSKAEYVFKITLVGDGAVGKTSIRNSYMGYGFSSSHLMTLGADFAVTEKEMIPDEIWKFQIWDVAGQPMFSEVRPRFYRGSMGALLVFDVTDKNTFKSCTMWVREVYQYCGKNAIPIILLANKTDLRNRKSVNMKQAEKFIRILNTGTASFGVTNHLLETSAKSGLNIDLAFEKLGKAIRASF